MDDNFYLADLLGSLREDTTMERYWPLIPIREELLRYLTEQGLVFRDDVTDAVMEALTGRFGEDTVRLFRRCLHLYDFNPAKLRELKQVTDPSEAAALSELLRLPGVKLKRAGVYYHSGVTLRMLAEQSTEEIRDSVRAYLTRENRTETAPFPKEVNCHRAVAKMLLHRMEALQEECGDDKMQIS